MWSQIALCLLVGLAAHASNPAWKDNTEYVYRVRARTLTSLHELSDKYTGILIQATLTVHAINENQLQAQITDSQYSEIHADLPRGWETEIPQSELSYQALPLSQKPFQITMENGAIRQLRVNKDISNWEANIIKSIVSQIQLDTQGQYLIPSHVNTHTLKDGNSAVFKTMEETVTGIAETLYEIHPLPEQQIQAKPWLVPLEHLRANGDNLQVVKTKNYTHSQQRPAYHYGFDGIDNFEPTNNKVGEFYNRATVSRAVISGSASRFTIQSAVTVDQIMVSPTWNDKQQGSVNTMLNLTLVRVQPSSQQPQPVADSIDVGLLYSYDSPYAQNNQVQSRQSSQSRNPSNQGSDEANDSSSSSEEDSSIRNKRFSREFNNENNQQQGFFPSTEKDSSEEQPWSAGHPKLEQAPGSPLLPFTVGYQGRSIKQNINVVEETRKLAEQIGQEFEHPNEIPQKNTVGKFVQLASLLRIMNSQEMQQVASQLYTKSQHGAQANAWAAYRDAVAQSGTGPALLSIKEWIKSNKIENRDAAEVVAVLAASTRQPTEEYMTTFFNFVKSVQEQEQRYLNESALLAYTKLVHQVYVNEKISHGQFPVHSFGPFRTQSGKNQVQREIIPYLSEKLQQAIQQADTQKIHAYIRALGNVGHRKILEAFEPYLEGKKQASQFQRVLMVVALDKLATSNPRVARSVLYKIYQNPTEDEQVRVAAVYQLMRTSPPAEMLQRMAVYTSSDPSEYVNSAVASSIKSAVHLKGAEHDQFRKAAIAAESLLPNKNYGAQYSHNHLRSYVNEQMQLTYKQSLQHYGSEDNILPKGIAHKLRAKFAGNKVDLWTMQAMVSSIDDLVDVMSQQTKENSEKRQLKQSNRNAQQTYSPENIAKALDMDLKQREQLEGFLYLQMGPLQKMFSFDNDTLEDMPQVLQKLEEYLKNGIQYQEKKMLIGDEYALSFPTILGLPFLYTYDKPILINQEAKLRASAQPQISTGSYLQKPQNVEGAWEVHATVSARSQSQFGFVAPFNHHRYSAGYEKNFQVQIPLSGEIQYNVQENQVKLTVQRLPQAKNPHLIHFSTWPYTWKESIYSQQNDKKHIIRNNKPQQINTIIGDKTTGIALEVQFRSDRHMDAAWLIQKLQRHDPISALLAPWVDEQMQNSEINVKLNSEQSSTNKITLRFGYQQNYQQRKPDESHRSSPDISKFEQIPNEPSKRQKEFMKRSSPDIDSAHVRVYDASVEFTGQQNIQYVATVATAKSNVDAKGRLLLQVLRSGSQIRPLKFFLSSKSHVPNTNGLNADFAMQFDPTSTIQFQASFGENYLRSTMVNGQLEYRRSENRKQYLMQQPEYHECKREMQEGNQQLPACASITAQANFLDQFNFKLQYQNMNPVIENATYKVYGLLRHALYPRVEEDITSGTGSDHVLIQGQFSPDFQTVNVSIAGKQAQVQIRDAPLNEMARAILVPHPVFHVRSRVLGQWYNYQVYRPFCVVDKSAVNTFDNKTYPASLKTEWTALLQYVPKRPARRSEQVQQQNPASQQLADQIDTYAVLARASPRSASQKEVKIVVQTANTQLKLVEIEMQPSQQQPKVYINGQEINYNQQEAQDIYQGYIQVYGLPNAEVKVEVSNAFYVIYDGERVKVTIVDNKFRDSTRGLCGTFDGESQTDFTDPNNCIQRDPQNFVNSYSVLASRKSKSASSAELQSGSNRCYQKTVRYVDVISRLDIEGSSKNQDSSSRRSSSSSCSKLQTQYVEEGDEICFTIRPQPACKSGCQQNGQLSKNVAVHCVKSTAATGLWKSQIDKGNSPDFSLKAQTKTMQMSLPQGCSQQ